EVHEMLAIEILMGAAANVMTRVSMRPPINPTCRSIRESYTRPQSPNRSRMLHTIYKRYRSATSSELGSLPPSPTASPAVSHGRLRSNLGPAASAFGFPLFPCVDPPPGNFLASHAASAALTSAGFSCAIRWPLFTTTSVRSEQWARIGSARREVTVSQV